MVVGGVSVVVDSHSCPCLCVDAVVATTYTTLKSGGGDGVCWKRKKKQYLVRRGWSMELMSTSFLDPLCANTSFKKKQRRDRRLTTIVNELGGLYEDTFDDVKTQILNHFTCKAVRIVLQQLYEMNPPQYRWFYNFVATNKPSDGRRFLRSLGKEQRDLAERVMVTRLHLYGKWVKKCNHAEIYKEISDENLELMRERLMETVIWPLDDTNTEKIG